MDVLLVLVDDVDGSPGIGLNEIFHIDVHDRDLVNGHAVFSGHLDVLFDNSDLEVTKIIYDVDYSAGQTGTINNGAGKVYEAGASDGLTPPLDTRVFTLEVRAPAIRDTTVTTEVAENVASQILSYDPLTSGDQRDNTIYGDLTFTSGIRTLLPLQ